MTIADLTIAIAFVLIFLILLIALFVEEIKFYIISKKNKAYAVPSISQRPTETKELHGLYLNIQKKIYKIIECTETKTYMYGATYIKNVEIYEKPPIITRKCIMNEPINEKLIYQFYFSVIFSDGYKCTCYPSPDGLVLMQA